MVGGHQGFKLCLRSYGSTQKTLGKVLPELYLLNSDFYFVALFQVF